MKHRILDTPTGQFVLIQNDDQSIATSWMNAETRSRLKRSTLDPRLLPDLYRRLQQFFKGKAVDFSDVPLPAGGAFYRRCWKACRRISPGETRTYAELAALAGSPAAFRAAGQAMRNNPQPIITPCHRVIASGGNLHGFGGSCIAESRELNIKRTLLEIEGALAVTA